MLKLVKLDEKYKKHLFEMMDEWTSSNEVIIPGSIAKIDYHYFDIYLNKLEVKVADGHLVPDSTYFCLDEERNIFVGAVNIRHYLNDGLLLAGGHIGDGIRPSERRKGLGSIMVGLALEKCKEMGINKVLMVCDKDNIASAKTIIKNKGVLENEVEVNDKIIQRYWICL